MMAHGEQSMSMLKKWRQSYYVPGADERLVADALKRTFWRPTPAFPRTVQIETHSVCNGGCIFCPYDEHKHEMPQGRMSDEQFERLVREIAEHDRTRRISPYLTNEPFLDPTILEKCRLIKRLMPRTKVTLTSNAGKLSPRIVADMARDNPLDELTISMQGIRKEPYEQTMRGSLVFEETMANVEHLVSEAKAHMPGLKIVVTMVKTNVIDAEEAVAHWRGLGVESKYTMLENRGGNMKTIAAIKAGKLMPYRRCPRLFKQAYITWDGEMVLCCSDYTRQMVLGNALESSIAEVWNSPRAMDIRKDFIRGDLSQNPLCRTCLIGSE
jgi:MoaA/NifB/PqqE/SkfB family radical SAM enzyme